MSDVDVQLGEPVYLTDFLVGEPVDISVDVVSAPLVVFEHVQDTPQAVWTPIEHNFGRYPVSWSLFDDTGRECWNYTVQHLDVNTVRVSMDTPTAGLIRMI